MSMGKMYDVAVIGGGPAGYVAAIKAAQMGGAVILFEKDALGGVCLNRGCIPTKTYLKTAEELDIIRNAKVRGIVNDPSACVDMPKVLAYKDGVVKRLSGGVGALLASNGITVVYGSAAMASPTAVACGGRLYEAASTILCTGSKPCRIPIPGAESKNVLLSDGLLQLREVPPALVVIGGGVIGCEMAAAFNGFGSKVTVIEVMDRLVANMDADISAAMHNQLKKAGVSVYTGRKVERICGKPGGGSAVFLDGGPSVRADKILLSAGRVPDTGCLGSLEGQIRLEHGKIAVDEHMRTSIPNIYAAGDVNGRLMLAHAAFKMGETAAANAMGEKAVCNLAATPSCIYTMPEAASVGLSEEEAKRRLGESGVSIGRFPFAANGRALSSGSTDGFVKVVVERRYGEILGVHIVGASAAEMIAEAAALVAAEITAYEASEIIHPHPSFSEAFMEACADSLGKCVHLPKRR